MRRPCEAAGALAAAPRYTQPPLVPLSLGVCFQIGVGAVSGLVFPFQAGPSPLQSSEREFMAGIITEAFTEAIVSGKLKELKPLRKPPFKGLFVCFLFFFFLKAHL